jgi:hypothetical protein
MYSVKNLVDDLSFISRKVLDTQCLFDEYLHDDYLQGIKDQADFYLDILKTTDLLVYGYHRYVHEINSKTGKQSKDMIEGRIALNDFAHLMLDKDDLFDGYPTNDEIHEEANLRAREEMSLQSDHLYV